MDALEAARSAASRLCLDMRFMTRAVLSLRIEVAEGEGLPRCDGRTVTFFDGGLVASCSEEPNSAARDLAHCVMHCILGHGDPGVSPHRSLAEDMIVEYILDTLDAPSVSVDGREERMFVCERMFAKAGAPAPDLLADAVSETSRWQLGQHMRLFTRDDHGARGDLDGAFWSDIALQAMTEVEGFSRSLEGKSDAFLAILRIRNARRYDYRSFLRKFVSRRTSVRESPDEFDPIYYTYGLQMYGNLPLIDSLEQSDSNRLESFVIAIDTSGSTMAGPVRAFLEEAFDALRQAGVSSGSEVHVVQCDDEVRRVDVVRSEGDLRRLMKGFGLAGGGRTDFRPVFRYIESVMDEGGLRNLRGMMYFTDGYGTFPSKRPPYDVAFVFCDDSYREHRVPPWAMSITVRTGDLMEGRERDGDPVARAHLLPRGPPKSGRGDRMDGRRMTHHLGTRCERNPPSDGEAPICYR